MRTFYPFGWIDRDLKNLGFLRDMSASAAKLYILYVLAGGAEGKSCCGIRALQETTGLSTATICRARQELKGMKLIVVKKEMVPGRKNKKPKIWVELQDLPVNRLEIKQIRRSGFRPRTTTLPSSPRIEPPAWIKQAAERLRRKRENVPPKIPIIS